MASRTHISYILDPALAQHVHAMLPHHASVTERQNVMDCLHTFCTFRKLARKLDAVESICYVDSLIGYLRNRCALNKTECELLWRCANDPQLHTSFSTYTFAEFKRICDGCMTADVTGQA